MQVAISEGYIKKKLNLLKWDGNIQKEGLHSSESEGTGSMVAAKNIPGTVK